MECLWIYSKGERKPRDGFEQGLVCSELVQRDDYGYCVENRWW